MPRTARTFATILSIAMIAGSACATRKFTRTRVGHAEPAVPGGVEGGIAGGASGGVVGGLPPAPPPPPPPPPPLAPRATPPLRSSRTTETSDSVQPVPVARDARSGASRARRGTTPSRTSGGAGTPQPSPSAPVVDDVVARFVNERMVPGSAAFVAPAVLTRGVAGQASLRIAPARVSPAELEQELRSRLEGAGVGHSASIRIAPRMRATLATSSPSACDVTLQNPPDEKAVPLDVGATWTWAVMPKPSAAGRLTLTVTLVAPVIVDGRETGHEVHSYERQVEVRVGYWDQLNDSLGWMGMVSGALGSVGAIALGVLGWIRKTRASRPPRAGF